MQSFNHEEREERDGAVPHHHGMIPELRADYRTASLFAVFVNFVAFVVKVVRVSRRALAI